LTKRILGSRMVERRTVEYWPGEGQDVRHDSSCVLFGRFLSNYELRCLVEIVTVAQRTKPGP
jgi:hypothetical protein